MSENEIYSRITQAIIGAAIEVHKGLGPGLLNLKSAGLCTGRSGVES